MASTVKTKSKSKTVDVGGTNRAPAKSDNSRPIDPLPLTEKDPEKVMICAQHVDDLPGGKNYPLFKLDNPDEGERSTKTPTGHAEHYGILIPCDETEGFYYAWTTNEVVFEEYIGENSSLNGLLDYHNVSIRTARVRRTVDLDYKEQG